MSEYIRFYGLYNELDNSILNNISILLVFGEKERNIIFINKNDDVYSKGIDNNGCLGVSKQIVINKPIPLRGLSSKGIMKFIYGYKHVISLTKNGQIFCWGDNFHGQLGGANVFSKGGMEDLHSSFIPVKLSSSGKVIKDISCGQNHTIALTVKGEVYTWGQNDRGQIGNSTINDQPTPYKVKGLGLKKVTAIACGNKHVIALRENGDIYSWGDNSFGQIGFTFSRKMENEPKQLILDNKTKLSFIKVACGPNHTLVLSNENDIYTFGTNKKSQLGFIPKNKKNMPRILTCNYKFIDIAATIHSELSVAISIDGSLLIWGLCGNEVIDFPTITQFNSFNKAFAYFSDKRITYESLVIKETFNTIEEFHDAKYEKEFNERSLIAVGSFGIVFKAIEINKNELYAIKKIPLEFENIDRFSKELEIMKDSESKYVVECYSAWIEPNYCHDEHYSNMLLKNKRVSTDNLVFSPGRKALLHIQMELCYKNLKEILAKIKKELKLPANRISLISYYVAGELFIEILECIDYLHKKGIIHRDLKPQNILITPGICGRFVKIGDFGLATTHYESQDESHTKNIGTLKYMAPEVTDGEKYNTKADMYSLGKIAQELFNFSFNRETTFETNKADMLKEKFNSLSHYLHAMMDVKIDMRPSCEDVLCKEVNWKINLDIKHFGISKQIEKWSIIPTIDGEFHKYFIRMRMNIQLKDTM